MKILVTGGAGYIGSFMAKRLIEEGHDIVVADDLSRGNKENIPEQALFMQGNLLDRSFLTQLFSEHQFEAVMHFAGYIAVGESMAKPGMYFTDNVSAAVSLLDAMVEYNVRKFIFSSTGTVYGSPQETPIPETHPTNPENPYAETKRMIEKILHWYFVSHGIQYAALRYFNACGGALDGSHGESHHPETHIIPNAVKAALQHTPFPLYGTDYETKDGTCIRDYIHVLDLTEAHLLALDRLGKETGENIYNVGTGKGYSNKEVIEMVKKVTGVDFPIQEEKRREGDTDVIIADTTKIQNELGFIPRYSDLETIIKTAYEWHKKSIKSPTRGS